jgi:hypothetical protein
VAADVVATLRFPSYGEISGALVRALGIGRATLVTAGTPVEEEFPPGTVVPVSPGVFERSELLALLHSLAGDPDLRERVGAQARRYVSASHELGRTVERLWEFVAKRLEAKRAAPAVARARPVPSAGLQGFVLDEVRWYAQGIGVPLPDLVSVVSDLLGPAC